MFLPNVIAKFFADTTSPEIAKRFATPKIQMHTPLRYQLTAAAIIRNEARYLAEWLCFHLAAGVEHFVLYDNVSDDDTEQILAPFVSRGLVTVISWPHFIEAHHTQALAYAHALALVGPDCRWMAFIDADEFLFSPQGVPPPQVLCGYEDIPVLNVYRHFFGPSGQATPPSGLVIDNFNMRCEPPTAPSKLKRFMVPKSIVQPSRVRGTVGAHRPMLDDPDLWGYDENKHPIRRSERAAFSAATLCINHYYTRDLATHRARYRRALTAANSELTDSELDINLDLLVKSPVVDTRIRQWRDATCRLMEEMDLPHPSVRAAPDLKALPALNAS